MQVAVYSADQPVYLLMKLKVYSQGSFHTTDGSTKTKMGGNLDTFKQKKVDET